MGSVCPFLSVPELVSPRYKFIQDPGRVGMANKMLIVPLLNEEEVFGERKCEHYQVL